jgi:GrpB-like predicted nucleotidyltransferase (UPF0157 family)
MPPNDLGEGDRSGLSAPAATTGSHAVVVVSYIRAWPEAGAELIRQLREALGPLAQRVEHIGSTAVPGMAAKNVLDMQVSVADLDEAARAFDAPLAALGFRRKPHERDHVPVGSLDDPGRWAKRFWSRRGHPSGDVNLHVRVLGSPNERLALLFRDWFRAHPEAVPSYGAFKFALADIAPDSGTYSNTKDPVVDLVAVVAESWAAHIGWRP